MADAVLLWHFHQPSYVDALTGEVLMPWVRLHTVRGYADMAEMARRHAGVKMNFNLTPVLVQQIEQMAEGGLVESVRDWWRSKPEEKEPKGRKVAEEVREKLPDALTAKEAWKAHRDRLRALDKQTKED